MNACKVVQLLQTEIVALSFCRRPYLKLKLTLCY